MRDVIEEMSRYGGHGDPPPFRGAVFNRWLNELRRGADDYAEALRENERLKMEIETLKTRGKK